MGTSKELADEVLLKALAKLSPADDLQEQSFLRATIWRVYRDLDQLFILQILTYFVQAAFE